MIHFVLPAGGEAMVEEFLTKERPEFAARCQIVGYGALAAQRSVPRGLYVLSGLDQLSDAERRFAAGLADSLRDGGAAVLNDPRRSLRRYELLQRLHQLRRNDFRALRVGETLAGLRYPVFLRRARAHEGPLSPLLQSRSQVEQEIGRAIIQGIPLDDLLVVEFCPTAGADRQVRKYGAFVVGARILARSLEHSAHWSVKLDNATLDVPNALEEHEYVFGNPHREALAPIFTAAGIEYGRIDYAIRDDRIQTWEINTNPTIGRGSGRVSARQSVEVKAIRDESRECFFDRFRAAWEQQDMVPGGVAIALRTGSTPLPSGSPRRLSLPGAVLAPLRALVRPVKPIAEPLAAPLLRLLGRWAGASQAKTGLRRED